MDSHKESEEEVGGSLISKGSFGTTSGDSRGIILRLRLFASPDSMLVWLASAPPAGVFNWLVVIGLAI